MTYPSRKGAEAGFWATDPTLAQRAKQLWTDGLSATEVARELGAPSRNVIIGKVNRMGLQRTTTGQRESMRAARLVQSAQKERERVARARLKAEATAKRERGERRDGGQGLVATIKGRVMTVQMLPPEPADDVARITEIRRGCCKWPVGEPGADGFGFCGVPTERTYCEGHHARASGGPCGNLRAVAAYAAKTDRLGATAVKRI